MPNLLKKMVAHTFIEMVKNCAKMVQEDPELKKLLDRDDVAGIVKHLQGYAKQHRWSRDARRIVTWYIMHPATRRS